MRLTNNLKDQILNDVLKKLIIPKVDEIKASIAADAQKIAEDIYPKEIKDWMAQGPADAFHMRDYVDLEFVDKTRFNHPLVSGRRYNVYLPKRVPVLYKGMYADTVTIPKELETKFQEYLKQLDALEAKQTEIKTTVNTALSACTTVKQLRANYPELAAYLPEIAETGKALAIPADKVRAVLEEK